MSTRTTFGRHTEPSIAPELCRTYIAAKQVRKRLMGKVFDYAVAGLLPGLSLLKKFRMVMGMLYFMAGIVVLG